MGAKAIFIDFIPLAFQLSIVVTMFGYGLRTTREDALYFTRVPWLLVASLLSMFVVVPAFAFAIALTFPMDAPASVAIVSLAVVAVPPLLPWKEVKAGGDPSYARSLTLAGVVASLVLTPALAAFARWQMGRGYTLGPASAATAVMGLLFLPLLAGSATRIIMPNVADRIASSVSRVANGLMVIAFGLAFFGTFFVARSLLHTGTVVGLLSFILAALVTGHLLGAPDTKHSIVLALASANRHPGIAFTIAATTTIAREFAAAVVLLVVLSELVVRSYVIWAKLRVEEEDAELLAGHAA
jgi:bile acid:Na+ symporter, BASS family